jgi:hypothetical protein
MQRANHEPSGHSDVNCPRAALPPARRRRFPVITTAVALVRQNDAGAEPQ